MDYPPVPCLDYATLRPQIQSGDLLLCSGSALFSRLIQHATGSPWSHVAVLYWMTTLDRLMVLESVESIGVRTVPVSQYADNYKGSGKGYPGRVFIARHQAAATLQATQWQQFTQYAVDRFGYVYATEEITRIAACIVAPALSRQQPDVAQARSFICSEFAAACFGAVGIAIPWNPRGYIAPADFATDPAVTVLWELDLS